MFLGVQIVSISIMIYVIVGFSMLRKLPTLSTLWFKRFLYIAVLNFVLEMFSLLTLYERLPKEWNRLSHQMFFVSLMLVLHSVLIFIDIKSRNQRRYTLKEILFRSIPLAITIPVVAFGELHFHVEGMVRYSQGFMVTGISLAAAGYFIAFMVLTYRIRARMSKMEKGSFAFVFLFILFATVIQLLVPYLLLTSMSVAMLALNIFMVYENPREYADSEVKDALNKNAFLTMVNEYIQRKQEFYIVSMTLTNSKMLKDAKGYKATMEYVQDAAVYLKEYANTSLIFHPKRDWVSLIFSDKKMYYAFMEEQRELFLQDRYNEHGAAKFMVNILKCPEYASSVDEIVKVIDYVDKIKKDVKESIFRIDEKVLESKNQLARVEAIVQKAIENDGFEVHYQPIYSNSKKGFVSAEALVRLKDTDTMGYISPEIFIPVAEENGMIHELGNIVFRKVCQFVSERKLESYGVHYVEVNLSGAQFMDDKLNEILSECVKSYNVDPEFINLEITETASVEAASMLEYNMYRLKENRFKFSMDDFGTGYSNLAKIAQSNFDMIKLDKSLIWPCFDKLTANDARIILESSVDMILKLGKDIVAEGVETKAQVEYLTELGVEYLQGYYYSKPIPEEKYLEFLQQNNELVQN